MSNPKCPECGCIETKHVIKDSMDGYIIMQYEVRCIDCDEELGYWAHGNYECYIIGGEED